jgi:hypothetical protein
VDIAGEGAGTCVHAEDFRALDPFFRIIVDRKIAHWRDYLDPIAVFDAIGWPAAAAGSS